jgi:hypothetical protein
MAKAAAGGGGADSSVADQLRALGVKGVLVQMAERGQLLALKCEMPQCYHHKGRGAFDPVTTPRTKWAPSPDHYPILKSAGGHLVPENVRLSHIWCNNRDYGWRTQIRTLLAKGKSLAEIAEALNSKGSPRPTARTDGRPPWCARPTCPSAALRQRRERSQAATPLPGWTTDESQVRLIGHRLSWESSVGRE